MRKKWPRKIKRFFRLKRGERRITFTGDYPSWPEALRDSVGYDANVILEQTQAAILKVKNGEAAFERDSALFDRPEYSFPVLAGLLRAALMSGSVLSVVDFGGSLGSSYFQCRPLIPLLNRCEWLVIEQHAHVARGRQHFETGELRFYETMKDCLGRHQPNVLLLSSVIQYLPEPYQLLKELLGHGLNHVIIDRTAFLESGRERLTVQTVPETIYPASYPAWFLNEARLVATFIAAGYFLVTDFPGADTNSPDDEPAYYKGFIFEKKGLP